MNARTGQLAPIRRVALYGPFGWGNLGDAAIQEAMLHHARARRPELEFLAVSLNPDDTFALHGIPALPIERHWRPRPAADAGSAAGASTPPPATDERAGRRERMKSALASHAVTAPLLRALRAVLAPLRACVAELLFLRRSTRALRGVDLFVFSGGGQIADFWGGPWYHPYSMLKFALCARLAGCQVRVVSVGAGPIRHRLSAVFFWMALRLAAGRSYRDDESCQLLGAWGFTRRDPMVPDLAFGHPAGLTAPSAPTEEGRGPVIGISPIAYFHPRPGPWPAQDAERYARFLDVTTQTCASVRDAGREVVLFVSQIRNDRYPFDDLVEHFAGADAGAATWLDAEPTRGLDHLLEQIGRTDVVVTSRLHGVILSYLLHRPVIALSPDPKVDAVMRRYGQSEFCLDIETVRASHLQERLASMVERLPEIRARIRHQAALDRQALERQFDELFGRRARAAVPRPAPKIVRPEVVHP